jgi:tetratricopeptide (TPR) repeat protein
VNTCHLLTAFAWWAPARGYAYALTGRIAEGLSVLEEAVEWCASRHVLQAHARRLAWLAESHLLANHVAEATAAAEQAVAFAREHRERGNEALALRVLGEVAGHGEFPNVERAEDYYRQSLALAEERAHGPLAAHCHCGLGTLYRKVGRDEQAQVELATAAEMYRAMEMPFWLERAESELLQLGARAS